MAMPVAVGVVALFLQINPNLTPNLVKAIFMYTAQQLPGYNMFEQGAGQLNIEGAVRLAYLICIDLPANPQLGSPLLSTKTTLSAQTTLAGYTFVWGQGLSAGHIYVKGMNLITLYQKIYQIGVLLGAGMLVSDGVFVADGVLIADRSSAPFSLTTGDNTSAMPVNADATVDYLDF